MDISPTTSPQWHLDDSIQEIDRIFWLVAQMLILTQSTSPLDTSSIHLSSWSDGDGKFFILSDTSNSLPETKPLAQDSALVPRVHAVDDQAAFIKAHPMDYPCCIKILFTLLLSLDFSLELA